MVSDCWIYWARPRDARPRLRELFTDAERGRADAYRRAVDRDRFTVGCALSRIALGEVLGLDPVAVPLRRDCDGCGQPHGRPRLADDAAFVSVSHSGDHVVVAVTRVGPVGVDVEEHSERSLDVADAVLTANERSRWAALPHGRRVAAFLRYWTRKEAALKAIGRGLNVPMTSIEIDDADGVRAIGDDGDLTAAMAGLRLAGLAVDDRHTAALAVAAPVLPRLVHREATLLLSAE